jgi:hypothetical protein
MASHQAAVGVEGARETQHGNNTLERTTMYARSLASMAALGLTGALLLPGCGSTSKPAYCAQVTNLENSIKALEKVEPNPSDVSAITTAVQKVGTSANELTTALKTEFAPQTAAIKSSFAALEKSIKEVTSAPSSSTVAHAFSVVPAELESLKHSVSEIQEVTKSKCK